MPPVFKFRCITFAPHTKTKNGDKTARQKGKETRKATTETGNKTNVVHTDVERLAVCMDWVRFTASTTTTTQRLTRLSRWPFEGALPFRIMRLPDAIVQLFHKHVLLRCLEDCGNGLFDELTETPPPTTEATVVDVRLQDEKRLRAYKRTTYGEAAPNSTTTSCSSD